jgi:hypothetical protein
MARKTRRAPRKSGGGFFDFLFGSSNAKNEKSTTEIVDMVETVPENSFALPVSEEVVVNTVPAVVGGRRRRASRRTRKGRKGSRKGSKKSRKTMKGGKRSRKSRKGSRKSRKSRK